MNHRIKRGGATQHKHQNKATKISSTMTKSSNKISFPGINKNNFWNEITLKQRGNYPWTEDEMKIYFEVTEKQVSSENNWNQKQFETMANFIYDYIIKHPSPTSKRTRFRPTRTSTPLRPRRSQTPKARRTCIHCDTRLHEDHHLDLCQQCHLKIRQ